MANAPVIYAGLADIIVSASSPPTIESAPAHIKPIGEKIFLSNHPLKGEILDSISQKLPGKGIHVGIGGISNLDLIASGKMGGGVLCDINPAQEIMWKSLFDIISQTEDRFAAAQALSDFPALLHKQHVAIKGFDTLSDDAAQKAWQEYITISLDDRHSWLGSDENYSFIRGLIKKKALVPKTLDIASQAEMSSLAASLAKHNIPVADVFLSNVMLFYKMDDDFYDRKNSSETLKSVVNNIALLTQEQTVIIDVRDYSKRLERFAATRFREKTGTYMPHLYTPPQFMESYGVSAANRQRNF